MLIFGGVPVVSQKPCTGGYYYYPHVAEEETALEKPHDLSDKAEIQAQVLKNFTPWRPQPSLTHTASTSSVQLLLTSTVLEMMKVTSRRKIR